MTPARPRADRADLGRASHQPWAHVALGLAVLVTLLSATDAPFFRTDERTLAVFDPDTTILGAPSAWLARALWLLPLGNLTLRATLLGAAAAGIAAWVLVALTFRAARASDLTTRTLGPLAVAAALVVVLGPAWLSESASIGGGAAPGAALGLVTLLFGESLLAGRGDGRVGGGAPARGAVWPTPHFGRRVVWALLCGATLCESPWLTLCLVLVQLTETRDRQTLGARLSLLGVGLFVPALVLLAKSARLGRGSFGNLELLPPGSTLPLLAPGTALLAPGVFVLVGTGLALLTFGHRPRALFTSLGLFAFDLLVPSAPSASWSDVTTASPARDALHLAALAALAPLAALGFSRLGALAVRFRLPAAKESTAAGLVLSLATAAASIEDTTRTLEHTATEGAARFTEESLEQLPPRSLVLVRSPALGKRLLAAQATGSRPDVLVVPEEDLAKPGAIHAWLAREPRLELFVRDASLGHGASEHALAELLVVRPVYVEPNGSWQRRLLEHVAPDMPLARVSPHALTRTERLAAVQLGKQRLDRIRVAATNDLVSDQATLDLLDRVRTTTEDVISKLGDDSARELLGKSEANEAPRSLGHEGS